MCQTKNDLLAHTRADVIVTPNITLLTPQTQECIDDLNAKGGEPLCILSLDAACDV